MKNSESFPLVRLSNGNGPHEGRVELLWDGQWGTVCDDNWDNKDAEVVCRQLGFSGGIALTDEDFGAGSGQIWLDEVECQGTETTLADCRHPPAGVNDCSHSEDAGVLCSKYEAKNGGLKLKGRHRVIVTHPDSKDHGANMGPTWGRQDPGGPHVGPMILAIWGRFSAQYIMWRSGAIAL